MRVWRTFPQPGQPHPRLAATTAASRSAPRPLHHCQARERVPWRPAVADAASLGTPVGIGMLNPLLGEVIVITEIVVALMVIAVAPFGSQALGERAFRLRWFGNGPEPPAPEPGDNPL